MRDFSKPNQHLDHRFTLRISHEDMRPFKEFSELVGVDLSTLIRDAVRDAGPKVQGMVDAIHAMKDGDNLTGLSILTQLLGDAHTEIDSATSETISNALQVSSEAKTA